MGKTDWFIEKFDSKDAVGGLSFRIDEILFEAKTPYQHIRVLKNDFFGNVMLLDDIVMLTEKDEFYYHDMLMHVPLLCVDNPEKVLIIGGGDGGSIREALKHSCVKKVVLCEIDEAVIDISRRFFPSLSSGFDDELVELFIGDGIEYVKTHKQEFDCICIDSTDPVGPAVGLFTPEFYTGVNECLTPGGVMCAQTESPAWSLEDVVRIYGNVCKAFKNAHIFTAPSPCYPSGFWSYSIGLNSDKNPAEDFDRQRASQIAKLCKYYNPDIHRSAFALPNYIQKKL